MEKSFVSTATAAQGLGHTHKVNLAPKDFGVAGEKARLFGTMVGRAMFRRLGVRAHVALTAKLGDKIALLIEVQQAGIFQIVDVSEDELKSLLACRCAEMLYPFSRQIISDLATQGGFPQLLLQPMDFEELFAQANAADQAAAK